MSGQRMNMPPSMLTDQRHRPFVRPGGVMAKHAVADVDELGWTPSPIASAPTLSPATPSSGRRRSWARLPARRNGEAP